VQRTCKDGLHQAISTQLGPLHRLHPKLQPPVLLESTQALTQVRSQLKCQRSLEPILETQQSSHTLSTGTVDQALPSQLWSEYFQTTLLDSSLKLYLPQETISSTIKSRMSMAGLSQVPSLRLKQQLHLMLQALLQLS
jgi:hypothetical protein